MALSVIVPEQTSVNKQGNTVEPEIEEEAVVLWQSMLFPRYNHHDCHYLVLLLDSTLLQSLLVENKTVEALLDTGSPVTILSMNFIVNKWAQQKRESQSTEECREKVRGRLKVPSLILRNDGGDELNILKETTVKLRNGDHTCIVVVLLQKDPPHDLLLGTNLLSVLGFQFIQYENSTGKAVDMLTVERWAVFDEVQKPLGRILQLY